MKKSIALGALLVVLGTSVFAATPKTGGDKKAEELSFVQLNKDNGFGVKVDKEEAGKSFIMIYDADHNLIYKDMVSKEATGEKGYLITKLEVGDYTVEAFSKGPSVTRKMHVYEEGVSKSYFFYQ